MKKLFLALLMAVSALGMSACNENMKAIGNKMNTGSYTYYYAYVHSQITGDKYYHISGWAEYGPEGGTIGEAMGVQPYVGLELQLYTSKDVIYYYEPGLSYMLSKEYNSSFGPAIE